MLIFTTGGAGVGKSHLSKATKFLNNTWNFYSGTADEREVLFLIPTGVAAPNIDCTITHADWGINTNSNGSTTVIRIVIRII